MADPLLPCPCCNGEASYGYDLTARTYVYCTRCGLRTRGSWDRAGEGARWNERRGVELERQKIARFLRTTDFPEAEACEGALDGIRMALALAAEAVERGEVEDG